MRASEDRAGPGRRAPLQLLDPVGHSRRSRAPAPSRLRTSEDRVGPGHRAPLQLLDPVSTGYRAPLQLLDTVGHSRRPRPPKPAGLRASEDRVGPGRKTLLHLLDPVGHSRRPRAPKPVRLRMGANPPLFASPVCRVCRVCRLSIRRISILHLTANCLPLRRLASTGAARLRAPIAAGRCSTPPCPGRLGRSSRRPRPPRPSRLRTSEDRVGPGHRILLDPAGHGRRPRAPKPNASVGAFFGWRIASPTSPAGLYSFRVKFRRVKTSPQPASPLIH